MFIFVDAPYHIFSLCLFSFMSFTILFSNILAMHVYFLYQKPCPETCIHNSLTYKFMLFFFYALFSSIHAFNLHFATMFAFLTYAFTFFMRVRMIVVKTSPYQVQNMDRRVKYTKLFSCLQRSHLSLHLVSFSILIDKSIKTETLFQ